MRNRTLRRYLPALVPAAVFAIAAGDVVAQPRMRPPIPGGVTGAGDPAAGGGGGPNPGTASSVGAPTQGVTGAPAGAGSAPGVAGAPPGAPGAPGAKPVVPPGGRGKGDTTGLQQFEQGVEYEPRGPNYRVSFSLEDADLPELVRVIGQLTGKRFIFGGKVRNIKATVFSPQKVTVAEAYQAFLSILETNGLTVVPHGRFLKIIETPNAAAQGTPVYGVGQGATGEDRYITRIHRMGHVSADEAAAVLGHFKSKDGDITVYGPGNLLIITDTGTNIRRMLQIVEDIDVGGVGDQIWIEPIHYTAATDVANRLNEVFDLKGGGGSAPAPGKPGAPGGAPGGVHGGAGGGDLHIAKILPDDRSNSLVIVATERAYLRVLEFIKRIDVPHSGEGEIHVLPLQHADAVDLAKTLNEIITGAQQAGGAPGGGAPKPGGAVPLQGVFESGVKVSADKATNSLVITSSLRDYAALRIVIDRLDQPRRQVFIEAVIMDLSIKRQNQLGIAFHGGDVESSPIGSGQSLIYGGLNPIRTIGLPPLTDGTLNAFALGVRGPGLPGSDNLLGTGFSIPAFGILINALASTNDADILSTPHILALDNEKAEISVGQNLAIQQNAPSFGGLPLGGAAGAAGAGGLGALGGLGLGGFGFSAPRQDIGTKITITPHINDSNEVRMQITEEITELTGEAPQGTLGTIPYSKRTANTFLVVKDQQTVVIGGLVRNRVAKAQTKIPLLGDIPVLGALFRSSSDTMEKSNLILVVTPHIVRDQNDLRVIFERKMQERQEFLDHYFVFSDQPDYQPPKDYARTSGLLEDIRQGYFNVEERRRLDELTRPKSPRTHDPGQPLEMPAVGAPQRGGAAGPGTPGAAPGAPGAPPGANPAPPPAAPPPNLNITPPVRNIDRVEH